MKKFMNLVPLLWGLLVITFCSCEKNESLVSPSPRKGKNLITTTCKFCNIALLNGSNPFLGLAGLSGLRPVPLVTSSGHDATLSEHDIYKGKPAKLDWFPYTVQLSLRTAHGKGSLCSGSIYNPYTIITAAHCVFDHHHLLPHGHSKIYAGTTEAGKGSSRTIVKFIPHPKYKGKWTRREDRYDIALAILDRPLNYTDSIKPIGLAPRGKKKRGTSCYLSAFGSTTGGHSKPGTIRRKQWSKMIIRDDRDCQRTYPRTMFDARSNVCAGGNGRSRQCSGDSGGPLACSYGPEKHLLLYGVVDSSKKSHPSVHGQPCSDRSPGTYAYVPFYTNWIKQHAKH